MIASAPLPEGASGLDGAYARAVDLHGGVERAFNAGDADALAGLYERDARLLAEDGSAAEGVDAIRAVWVAFIAFGGELTLTTRFAVESGDLALLSNTWVFTLGGAAVASAITAEVARRQPDGTWRYVIDNPYAQPAAAGPET